jgi:hypothetical protein
MALIEVSRFSNESHGNLSTVPMFFVAAAAYREENPMNPIVPEQRSATTSKLTHIAAGKARTSSALPMPERNASALHTSSKIRENDSTLAGSTIIV